jgi:hypothetical protein
LLTVAVIWLVIIALYVAFYCITRAISRRIEVDTAGIRVVHLVDDFYKYSEMTEVELRTQDPEGPSIAFKAMRIPVVIRVAPHVDCNDLRALLKRSSDLSE